MRIKLTNPSIKNGIWISANQTAEVAGTKGDYIVECDQKFFLEITKQDTSNGDCIVNFDIYDGSIPAEVKIGSFRFTILTGGRLTYDWFPLSANYITQLADFYHLPFIFRVIKIPAPSQRF